MAVQCLVFFCQRRGREDKKPLHGVVTQTKLLNSLKINASPWDDVSPPDNEEAPDHAYNNSKKKKRHKTLHRAVVASVALPFRMGIIIPKESKFNAANPLSSRDNHGTCVFAPSFLETFGGVVTTCLGVSNWPSRRVVHGAGLCRMPEALSIDSHLLGRMRTRAAYACVALVAPCELPFGIAPFWDGLVGCHRGGL